ncbi:uncharacterized protein BCR38DRAFT_171525 [Pseudomassariella vexata]|uniref:Uncharacterized protein n=1 Tax=Pseudomassariella vexata TaxID=1141098 RepID=A0A1Y2E397_9PEZI|nr:uncharacterized protein BCR38DRAFT_171525 [Pseudomassariella vexata]ORY66018.1 hypothetical protein BCR38DRAFT_171525 [Pseudomassariella vexata]
MVADQEAVNPDKEAATLDRRLGGPGFQPLIGRSMCPLSKVVEVWGGRKICLLLTGCTFLQDRILAGDLPAVRISFAELRKTMAAYSPRWMWRFDNLAWCRAALDKQIELSTVYYSAMPRPDSLSTCMEFGRGVFRTTIVIACPEMTSIWLRCANQ